MRIVLKYVIFTLLFTANVQAAETELKEPAVPPPPQNTQDIFQKYGIKPPAIRPDPDTPTNEKKQNIPEGFTLTPPPEGFVLEKPDTTAPIITSGPMYPLDSFILNLAGEGGKRFLKLTVELELDNENLDAEIMANLPKIKDSILILLSSKTFEDVYTVEGKFRLRDEITARVNRFLTTGHVRNIYFTEFIFVDNVRMEIKP